MMILFDSNQKVGRKGKFPSKGLMKGNMPFIWQRPFGAIPGAVRFIFVSITILETLPLTS